MSLGTNRTRLALATFDAGRGLLPAVRNLYRDGFGSSQLGIAGLASVIGNTIESSEDLTLLSGLARDFVSAPQGVGHELVLGSGPFWKALDCFGRHPGDALVVARWMAPHLRDELATRLTNGAIVLGVTPTSIAQQAGCARILLTHSSDRVQTHDLRLEERPS
jgi:hypothetical protein